MPMGRLGFPLGTYLTIEGRRHERGKIAKGTLMVDTVNGKSIEVPIAVPIENLRGGVLPPDTRCVMRGYESGRMIGIPGEVARAEGLTVTQAAWQFFRYFVGTSVVQPKSLAVNRN